MTFNVRAWLFALWAGGFLALPIMYLICFFGNTIKFLGLI
tara:strand:+ start:2863 stop:2982 length:120 start_codon:yes stop_codon:yes gene_type:complete